MSVTYILPEIIIAISAVIILLFGFKLKNFSKYLALIGVFIALIALISISNQINNTKVIEIYEGIKINYTVDLFSVFFKLIFLSIAFFSIISSFKYANYKFLDAYYALILTATLGMLIVSSSNDLITLFVGLETAAIPAMILIAYERTKKGVMGATKYLLFGAIFSAILLLGMSLIYASTGEINFDKISGALNFDSSGKILLFLGIIAIFFGLAFEMSAAPFHAWAPDAYQGAPTPVSALLAGASKKMAFAAAFKILAIFLALFKVELGILIALLAILSMIVGNILALGQKDVKRMLAYSSIAQVGYILAAIAIFTPAGIAYALYYILVHAFMKGGAFIAAASAYFSSNGKIVNYDDYKGLFRKMPLTALFMAGFIFSLAGIVPFGGFTAKILILVEIFIEFIKGSILALILGLTMIITSIISLYYYGRLIKYMWFVEPEGNHEHSHGHVEKLKESLTFIIPMAIAFVALLIMFYPIPFVDVGLKIANELGIIMK